jgi:hypothetical protein
MGPKPTKQTKSRKEQILMMRNKNDQSRKIFSLRPYHLELSQSHLVLVAKQGQAQLVFEWERDLQKILLRQTVCRQGKYHQSSNGVTHDRLLINNQG